jgi:hypothetical protein
METFWDAFSQLLVQFLHLLYNICYRRILFKSVLTLWQDLVYFIWPIVCALSDPAASQLLESRSVTLVTTRGLNYKSPVKLKLTIPSFLSPVCPSVCLFHSFSRIFCHYALEDWFVTCRVKFQEDKFKFCNIWLTSVEEITFLFYQTFYCPKFSSFFFLVLHFINFIIQGHFL